MIQTWIRATIQKALGTFEVRGGSKERNYRIARGPKLSLKFRLFGVRQIHHQQGFHRCGPQQFHQAIRADLEQGIQVGEEDQIGAFRQARQGFEHAQGRCAPLDGAVGGGLKHGAVGDGVAMRQPDFESFESQGLGLGEQARQRL